MNQSELLDKFLPDWHKMQYMIASPVKSATNPHYKSKYANLKDVNDVIKGAFYDHGFSYTQLPSCDGTGSVVVTTIIYHKSGQWIKATLAMKPDKSNCHGVGSAITYARRYSLSSMVGLVDIDDDGNEAARSTAPIAKADPDKELSDFLLRSIRSSTNPYYATLTDENHKTEIFNQLFKKAKETEMKAEAIKKLVDTFDDIPF